MGKSTFSLVYQHQIKKFDLNLIEVEETKIYTIISVGVMNKSVTMPTMG